MRRATYFVITLGLIGASPAKAEWFPVTTSSNQSVWSMDFERIKSVGGKKQAWIQIDHSNDRSVPYRRTMMLESFDCSLSKARTLSVTRYDSYGKVVFSQAYTDYSYGVGYEPIIPDTVLESASKIACLDLAQ